MSNVKVFKPEAEILNKVELLGKQITSDYQGESIVLCGVLRGCVPFIADLMRYINLDIKIDFITVSSYVGTESSGVLNIKKDMTEPITGENVIIVEDVIDTGLTMNALLSLFNERKPKSLKVATLFDKPSQRKLDVNIDYCAFSIPNHFIVGYGLDFDQKYRNLRDVCILNQPNK
ncbi:MAG: hypoxanthine phosphoribosyltransferase [Clostridiales bacterium]|jgi:hypoxanthine phosphoribosyltransferase|nr:hypoxanthine phosphoribosyltransferase [Clostridiales bacterium]